MIPPGDRHRAETNPNPTQILTPPRSFLCIHPRDDDDSDLASHKTTKPAYQLFLPSPKASPSVLASSRTPPTLYLISTFSQLHLLKLCFSSRFGPSAWFRRHRATATTIGIVVSGGVRRGAGSLPLLFPVVPASRPSSDRRLRQYGITVLRRRVPRNPYAPPALGACTVVDQHGSPVQRPVDTCSRPSRGSCKLCVSCGSTCIAHLGRSAEQ